MADPLATEILCSACRTVAFGSEKAFGPGDIPLASDLVVVDERQPEPTNGMEVVCKECGAQGGFVVRSDLIAGYEPIHTGRGAQ